MGRRWAMLTVLFAARAAMGFQFQSVAAVSPLVMGRFDVGLAELGVLIGLYSAPGMALALPGGAIGARFGDSRAVAAGLGLMAAGGALMALGQSWESQIAGRLVSGAGGVLLNVLMTKMVADWFAGREIATAMGVFVNSWPVGIALALVTLPAVAETGSGAPGAMWTAVGGAVAGLLLVAALYRSPSAPGGAAAPAQRWIAGRPLACALVGGGIWGAYNAAFAMIFGFGPAMLAARGFTLAEASATTSLALWTMAAALPFGGALADRLGRRDAVIVVGLVLMATALIAAADGSAPAPLAFAALGIAAGLPAGPIMSLPAAALPAEARATGMGVFFTVYYGALLLGPALGGASAAWSGSAAAPFLLGAGWAALALVLLAVHRPLARSAAARAVA